MRDLHKINLNDGKICYSIRWIKRVTIYDNDLKRISIRNKFFVVFHYELKNMHNVVTF